MIASHKNPVVFHNLGFEPIVVLRDLPKNDEIQSAPIKPLKEKSTDVTDDEPVSDVDSVEYQDAMSQCSTESAVECKRDPDSKCCCDVDSDHGIYVESDYEPADHFGSIYKWTLTEAYRWDANAKPAHQEFPNFLRNGCMDLDCMLTFGAFGDLHCTPNNIDTDDVDPKCRLFPNVQSLRDFFERDETARFCSHEVFKSKIRGLMFKLRESTVLFEEFWHRYMSRHYSTYTVDQIDQKQKLFSSDKMEVVYHPDHLLIKFPIANNFYLADIAHQFYGHTFGSNILDAIGYGLELTGDSNVQSGAYICICVAAVKYNSKNKLFGSRRRRLEIAERKWWTEGIFEEIKTKVVATFINNGKLSYVIDAKDGSKYQIITPYQTLVRMFKDFIPGFEPNTESCLHVHPQNADGPLTFTSDVIVTETKHPMLVAKGSYKGYTIDLSMCGDNLCYYAAAERTFPIRKLAVKKDAQSVIELTICDTEIVNAKFVNPLTGKVCVEKKWSFVDFFKKNGTYFGTPTLTDITADQLEIVGKIFEHVPWLRAYPTLEAKYNACLGTQSSVNVDIEQTDIKAFSTFYPFLCFTWMFGSKVSVQKLLLHSKRVNYNNPCLKFIKKFVTNLFPFFSRMIDAGCFNFYGSNFILDTVINARGLTGHIIPNKLGSSVIRYVTDQMDNLVAYDSAYKVYQPKSTRFPKLSRSTQHKFYFQEPWQAKLVESHIIASKFTPDSVTYFIYTDETFAVVLSSVFNPTTEKTTIKICAKSERPGLCPAYDYSAYYYAIFEENGKHLLPRDLFDSPTFTFVGESVNLSWVFEEPAEPDEPDSQIKTIYDVDISKYIKLHGNGNSSSSGRATKTQFESVDGKVKSMTITSTDSKGRLEHKGIKNNFLTISTHAKKKYNPQGYFGFKAAITATGDYCIVKIRIPADGLVACDAKMEKYRTNKCKVLAINRVKIHKGKHYYVEKLVDTECPVCMVNNTTHIAAPCLHKLCGDCWLKIVREGQAKCPYCSSAVKSVTQIIDDETDTTIHEAYPCVFTDSNLVYKVGEEIVIPDFDPNLGLACAAGIHFHMDVSETFKWFEYVDVKNVYISNIKQLQPGFEVHTDRHKVAPPAESMEIHELPADQKTKKHKVKVPDSTTEHVAPKIYPELEENDLPPPYESVSTVKTATQILVKQFEKSDIELDAEAKEFVASILQEFTPKCKGLPEPIEMDMIDFKDIGQRVDSWLNSNATATEVTQRDHSWLNSVADATEVTQRANSWLNSVADATEVTDMIVLDDEVVDVVFDETQTIYKHDSSETISVELPSMNLEESSAPSVEPPQTSHPNIQKLRPLADFEEIEWPPVTRTETAPIPIATQPQSIFFDPFDDIEWPEIPRALVTQHDSDSECEEMELA
jgi:hypothetical protein